MLSVRLQILESFMMESYLDKFILYLKNELKYSENTCISYENDLKIFLDYLQVENIALADVDYFCMRYYIVKLSQQEYSKNSIRRNISAVSSFFNYLVKKSLLTNNPVALVDSIKKDQYLPEFLYVEEVKMLVAACNMRKYKLRDKLIVMMLFYNGLRVSELTSINVTDISGNKVKIVGKGRKDRLIILSKTIRNLIDEYVSKERSLLVGSTNRLFVNHQGGALTPRGVRYIITEISKASELDKQVYPHMLRHSFATYFLTHGSDLRTVQTFLGHENISTTQVYTHLSHSELASSYNSFHPRSKKSK